MEQIIATPNNTKYILNKYSYKMKKSLGQNFLIDENIIKNIIEKSDIKKDDIILEIGPGIGSMTQILAKYSKKVIAVEIESNLVSVLNDIFKDEDNIEIINKDILKLDIDKLLKENSIDKIKVVANLPYYITTPIIMKLLEREYPIESITIMIQKEVADRINAEKDTKDYGALTIACNYYASVERLLTVPNTVFIPRPNVDSSVIKLIPNDNNKNEKLKKIMFALVRDGFSKRRKTLLNSLSSGNLGIEKSVIKDIFNNLGLDTKLRAENLSILDFKNIGEEYIKLINKN